MGGKTGERYRKIEGNGLVPACDQRRFSEHKVTYKITEKKGMG